VGEMAFEQKALVKAVDTALQEQQQERAAEALRVATPGQLGMLAGTIAYVNAGTQIAQIETLSGILSPELLGSFLLLAVFPFVAKRVVGLLEARKVYAPWRGLKPAAFDRNLVVIGAGSAGLVSSYIAATVKAKVTLVERHRMGGDCLNTGCVPSKAPLRSAKFVAQARRAQSLRIRSASLDFAFADVMERVQRVIKTVEPHDAGARAKEGPRLGRAVSRLATGLGSAGGPAASANEETCAESVGMFSA
jgi:hypothetical protein